MLRRAVVWLLSCGAGHKMIAPLISITGLAAALQFVYYCRSALAGVRNVEPSRQVLRAAGLDSRKPYSDDFNRLVELASLCPEHGKDGALIRAVAIYYRVLRALEFASHHLAPIFSTWTIREQASCAHFAAVALERRISSSRELFLQHATNRL
jgi:hypothetical protein